MDRTCVFLLFVLLVPVSSEDVFFTEPVICYFLDSFLVIYCIIATVLYFKEKFAKIPSAAAGAPGENGGIYQELERPKDTDLYQMLEPSKAKKKGGKKEKKSGSNPAEDKDKDPSASLITNSSAAPPEAPQ